MQKQNGACFTCVSRQMHYLRNFFVEAGFRVTIVSKVDESLQVVISSI